MSPQLYDFVFAGTGLSGLCLAVEMATNPAWSNHTFCLIDRDHKTTNDRTWCFWATPDEVADLPPVMCKTWKNCHFYSPTHAAQLNIEGYQYYMVRGIDFYQWALQQLENCPRVTRINSAITSINSAAGQVFTDDACFKGKYIFNSAFTPVSLQPALQRDQYRTPFSTNDPHPGTGAIYLLQHFKGWIIRTPDARFDPETVTFMDFRIPQQGDTRFVYVLPFSETEALVEFTVFSHELLPETDYTSALQDYVRDFLGIDTYTIQEQEFGIIPMSDYPLSPGPYGREIRIGTAGGFVKASSGYAFKRTHRRIKAFARNWAATGQPDTALLRSKYQFRLYDSVFLRALSDGLVPAHRIFGDFFKNLGGSAVFRFLDEESNFLEDIRALNAVPTWPFLKAAMRQSNRFPYV